MSSDVLMAVTALVMVALLAGLIVLCVQLNRSLAVLGTLLTELRRDLAPMLVDVRSITENLTEASGALRDGIQQATQITDAIGNIGADLETGRRTVIGGLGLLGGLLKPWLAKWTAPKALGLKDR